MLISFINEEQGVVSIHYSFVHISLSALFSKEQPYPRNNYKTNAFEVFLSKSMNMYVCIYIYIYIRLY